MSNGDDSSCFSWLSFLLGLAIGLWISVVALFLIDWDDDCDCGPPGTTIIAQPVGQDAWIPAGDGNYWCTNNDQGGAIVMDQGGAIVMDQGGAIVIDQGGAIVVDQGSAIVIDAGGHVPAPDDRDFEEFACETNDQGGAIVMDREGRIVVVSMPDSYASEQCGSVNGNATVINGSDERIQIDQGGAIVVDASGTVTLDKSADDADDKTLPGGPTSTSDLAYCVVDPEDADPIVIRP